MKGGFVESLRLTQIAQHCVTKIFFFTIMHIVAPKAGAKHELLINKPASAVV
jgi:hypothetical protein